MWNYFNSKISKMYLQYIMHNTKNCWIGDNRNGMWNYFNSKISKMYLQYIMHNTKNCWIGDNRNASVECGTILILKWNVELF